jgi:hypothetical protein
MAKKANPFKTWCTAIESRGVVAVPPPSYMKDWHDMKTDMLSMLDMKFKKDIRALARVAFGKKAYVDFADDKHGYFIMVYPSNQCQPCITIGYMREGRYINKHTIELTLPELELKYTNGQDLGWAYWLHRQLPRVKVYYPGCPS